MFLRKRCDTIEAKNIIIDKIIDARRIRGASEWSIFMKYTFVLHESNGVEHRLGDLSATELAPVSPYSLSLNRKKKEKYEVIELTVSSEREAHVYLSLMGEGDAAFSSFNGVCREERIFRQSPHDARRYHFRMEKSAIPMVAAIAETETVLFISDNPSYFDNATTQHILPDEKKFYLSSGDRGGTPNCPESDPFGTFYHQIGNGMSHTFRFIVFSSDEKQLKGIRREAYLAIEKIWGKGSDSLYRAMCFASNYMHVRVNETGTSEKWIVAGIEYSNVQYVRDSFYQSWILDEETEEQSYRALGHELKDAENPLIYLIWTYRIFKQGKPVNHEAVAKMLSYVKGRMSLYAADGGYYPVSHENGDFCCWFDTCAFAPDDVNCYNQGLLVCALEAVKRMGHDVGDLRDQAVKKYHALFNGRHFPLSEKKQCLALDFTVGEVLYYVLFNELFVDQTMFEKSYRLVCDGAAKTPYGIKIISAEDGSFLPIDIFGCNGYLYEGLKTIEEGRYQHGASWHLYEMLFHIAGYLHGMPDAEQNLTERLLIDLNYDGATHEYMHTVRGNGVKANQGWNAAIYAIWEELIARGVATDAFFRAADDRLARMQ